MLKTSNVAGNAKAMGKAGASDSGAPAVIPAAAREGDLSGRMLLAPRFPVTTVQPPADADAAHTAVRRSLPLEPAAAPGGRGGFTPVLSLDLFMAEMAGLSGLYSAGVLDYDEFDRSLIQLEIRGGAKPVLCEVCHARRASVTQGGKHICSWGVNNPTEHRRLPSGDEIDRGWDSYKEATS